MNGKRAKALKVLSMQSGIGYRPLKHIYNQLCAMDAVQEKTLLKQKRSEEHGSVSTQNKADKEIQ